MLLLTEIPMLADLIIVLGIAVVVILLLQRLRLPTVIGFIISGVISGPHMLNLVSSGEGEVEALSELGVVLLLFTIGLEFSLSGLMKIKKAVFVGGTLQVLLTVAAFAALSYFFGGYDYLPIAIFLGFIFTLSSTAIVLKVQQAKGTIKREHGQVILAIMIFQDIAVVPMMLLTPIMSGAMENLGEELAYLALKVLGILLFIIVSIKYIVPNLLYQIARMKSKDLFVVSIVVICFAIAWLTAQAGLSLALGAFLAGLVISESRYSYEAAGNILPFKEIFTSIFFVSVGMLLDVKFLAEHIHIIAILILLVMGLKALLAGMATFSLGVSFTTVLLVSLNVCQVGEFSFVMMKTGEQYGLLPIEIHQYLLSVSVLTMVIAPVVINYDQKIVNLFFRLIPDSRWKIRLMGLPDEAVIHNLNDELRDHIVIVGYGLMGRSLVHGAKTSDLQYVIIEQDPQIVAQEAKKGEPIIYGNADNEEVLHHAGAHHAKVVVVTTLDTEEASRLAHLLRRFNPKLFIISRTQHSHEAENLRHHGADVVIVDEVEANMEAIIQVLDYFELPLHNAYQFTAAIRQMAATTPVAS